MIVNIIFGIVVIAFIILFAVAFKNIKEYNVEPDVQKETIIEVNTSTNKTDDLHNITVDKTLNNGEAITDPSIVEFK